MNIVSLRYIQVKLNRNKTFHQKINNNKSKKKKNPALDVKRIIYIKKRILTTGNIYEYKVIFSSVSALCLLEKKRYNSEVLLNEYSLNVF